MGWWHWRRCGWKMKRKDFQSLPFGKSRSFASSITRMLWNWMRLWLTSRMLWSSARTKVCSRDTCASVVLHDRNLFTLLSQVSRSETWHYAVQTTCPWVLRWVEECDPGAFCQSQSILSIPGVWDSQLPGIASFCNSKFLFNLIQNTWTHIRVNCQFSRILVNMS